jgi:hypothetical protein
MGGSTYDSDAYTARSVHRAATGTSAFVHDAAIKSGKIKAGVDPGMSPRGVKIRESRDSAEHPVAIPIGVILDTTGSMQQVPVIIQGTLNKLMGTFLEDKVSGKKYLGDGYPAILIGAIDDYFAIGKDGPLQVGNYESGLEIEDDLGKLWFTGAGGGNRGENYDLAMYFFARHTAHDHFDKRGLKGYLFIVGDEPFFDKVSAEAVKAVIGDKIQSDIPIGTILAEVQERYHVYFILPKMTSGWTDKPMIEGWRKLLGDEHVIKLEDPEEICPLIASLVAANEGLVSLADLAADGIAASVTKALAVVRPGAGGSVAKVSASSLPAVGGRHGGVKRL